MTPTTKKRRRPKKVSISLPSSPRGTPSPRPPTPESNLPSSSHLVSSSVDLRTKKGSRHESTVITSPSALNDRITREQARRGSTPHIPKCIREEGEYDDQLSSPRVRAATTTIHHWPEQSDDLPRQSFWTLNLVTPGFNPGTPFRVCPAPLHPNKILISRGQGNCENDKLS